MKWGRGEKKEKGEMSSSPNISLLLTLLFGKLFIVCNETKIFGILAKRKNSRHFFC